MSAHSKLRELLAIPPERLATPVSDGALGSLALMLALWLHFRHAATLPIPEEIKLGDAWVPGDGVGFAVPPSHSLV